ncbi:HAD-IA family hydrolase [Paracoccus sp. S-4012]|uniref:HAD-IA family hydrolase n=1 Tax=Paracoccus sp. S-4012 TaxID=2665648 RepID=UPI0012B0B3C8|nr:HAD-IA family hydrolase [Paracoccus sp. S-4012]MRX51205.1 HAD-IA family hydrolase [Paracoccus sp. S-4012]
MLEALIFDVDGTLAETEELHRRAFNDCFAAAGLGWSWDAARYCALLRTTGGKERLARFILDEGGDPASFDIAALHADKTLRYTDLMAHGAIAPRPGVAELIEAARRAGLKLAVATTTSRPNIEALSLALFDRPASRFFDVIAAGDEVAAKKPAPDVYRLALDRLGIGPGRAVAVEDSLNGLRSAQGAGIACIVAPGRYMGAEDLSAAELVVPDLSGVTLNRVAALLQPQAALR